MKTSMTKASRDNLKTIALLVLAFAVVQALRAGGVVNAHMDGMLVPLCVYATMAVSLNLVVGILGELSLGHAGFMCVGAFSSAFFSKIFEQSMGTFPRFLLAILIGGIVAGIFGFLIGIPVLRLNGDYLAIVTLAFGEIIKNLMNVLYVGYNNPLSVSVPGVPLNKVQASMTGGTLQPVGPGRYIARPSAVGQNVTITVTSTNTGRAQQMGQFTFRVRRLPDPTPYIAMKDESGSPVRYKGGGLSKAQLMSVDGIGAAIDDGILDIAFTVQSFETVFFDNMGNAVPMVSDGAHFSARQKDTFRKLQRNRRFYISRVNAIGPDGIQRKLNASMEVIVK